MVRFQRQPRLNTSSICFSCSRLNIIVISIALIAGTCIALLNWSSTFWSDHETRIPDLVRGGTGLLLANTTGSGDIASRTVVLEQICNVSRDDEIFKGGNFQPFWKQIDNITASNVYKNAKISGGIFLYPRQTLLVTELIHRAMEISDTSITAIKKEKNTKLFRVCETGFAAGHSAALFLSMSENIQVVTFDKFDRPYQLPVLKKLEQEFPGRIHHVRGDSCITLPAFLQQDDAPRCDFLHGSSLCKTDNIDLVQHARRGTLLTSTAMSSLSDEDVYFGKKAQWRKLREDGCIADITCFTEKETTLQRSFQFGSKNELFSHKFCFAWVTGTCVAFKVGSTHVPVEGGVSINANLEELRCNFTAASNSNFLNSLCTETKIQPPM